VQKNSKKSKFRRIFAKKRVARQIAISGSFLALDTSNFDQISEWLNRAAPVQLIFHDRSIDCNAFGLVANGLISYRPRQRRADCTALVAAIRLSEIKGIKLI
jgi:hypothetical protein